MIKPSIPKGTRDFSPEVMARREFIFSSIKKVFHLHGFLPLETPAMENLSTLTGKYGDEGDQLIFKILNSGDYLKSLPDPLPSSAAATSHISEKALRYDLTIPFARYVVQHQNEITFPFRRYQIQPVWRADRPQKGRYREFYQCDADIIGTDSLLSETELVQVFDEVFSALDLPVEIRINNRKILQGIASEMGVADNFISFTVIIDKLEKAGEAKVREELSQLGIQEDQLNVLFNSFGFKNASNEHSDFSNFPLQNPLITEGLNELQSVISGAGALQNNIFFDPTLARGLNYYTGCIFEVKANAGDFQPSICGGGRYDDLTGMFGLKGVSGVGISFGADRIFDVLEATDKFPALPFTSTNVLFVNFGKEESAYAMKLAQQLRRAGISTEVYPDAVKMKKQFTYADQKKIPLVAIIGSEEIGKKGVMLKHMHSGEQEFVHQDQLTEKIKLHASH